MKAGFVVYLLGELFFASDHYGFQLASRGGS